MPSPSSSLAGRTVCCDLDGVVWRGDDPIPGAADALGRLRDAGARVVFLTNNSRAPGVEVAAKLAAHAVPTGVDDIVSSAQAAAALLAADAAPGTRVLTCAGPGVVDALDAVGLVPVTDDPSAAAVVVGWHRDFDFDRLACASAAVRAGARFVATNTDATFPDADGLLPGAGALVAAVAVASGVSPEVAGKPEAPMAALVLERIGAVALMIGDRVSTDGGFASRLGCPFALVLSGVTGETGGRGTEPRPEVAPRYTATDLAALTDELLSEA